MNRVGKMANDFYTNLISGFAQGLGLGGQNHRIGVLKRGSVERENDALALFGELLQQEDAENGGVGDSTQTPKKRHFSHPLHPPFFHFISTTERKKRKYRDMTNHFSTTPMLMETEPGLITARGRKLKIHFINQK
jgi:hypothetical protein